jgi:hypothetical protein
MRLLVGFILIGNLDCVGSATEAPQARPWPVSTMTDEECAECVLSDSEASTVRRLMHSLDDSREQKSRCARCTLPAARCPLPARNVRTVGAKRFCEPAFDHIYTDFDNPRMYSRFHVAAKGFGRFYGRVRLRAISPTVGNFSQTQSSAKVSLPYPASRVSHLHTIEVFDVEERFLPARGHVWLTPAGELPVDLAACGPSPLASEAASRG